MDESRYLDLVQAQFRRLEDAFEDIDIDDAEFESNHDVVTIQFASGLVVVLNTQRPVQQIWMAGGGRAWHFDWQESSRQWVDDREGTVTLESALNDYVKQALARPLFTEG